MRSPLGMAAVNLAAIFGVVIVTILSIVAGFKTVRPAAYRQEMPFDRRIHFLETIHYENQFNRLPRCHHENRRRIHTSRWARRDCLQCLRHRQYNDAVLQSFD